MNARFETALTRNNSAREPTLRLELVERQPHDSALFSEQHLLSENQNKNKTTFANGTSLLTKRLHVLITVNAAWNVANFRGPIVEALRADGHRITVLAPPDDAVAAIKALGCDFVPLRMDVKGLSPSADIALLTRLRRHFLALSPDVVLSFTIKNNIFGAFAARGLNVPFIPNVTGLGTAFLSSGILQRLAEHLYRAAFRPLSTVFFQNNDDRDLFVARGLVRPIQTRVLPGSGINLARFAPVPLPDGPETRFLMIAQLLRAKGVVEYVDAARRLRKDGLRARFQLLGSLGIENRTAISAEALAAWQAEGIIEYLGESNDVRREISQAHCVVLPSYYPEGTPRALLEAAAMARPIVTTDTAGCRDTVVNGVTGLLCRVRDAEDLAARMRLICQMPADDLAEMGRAGRAHAEARFDEQHVVDAYRQVLAATTDLAA